MGSSLVGAKIETYLPSKDGHNFHPILFLLLNLIRTASTDH